MKSDQSQGPAQPIEGSQNAIGSAPERQLASCLRRLLNTTELNMDDMEEETRQAIREALCVLETVPLHNEP